jgi:hypothetical protein
VRGHLQTERFAKRNGRRHPFLAQLVIGHAFQAVLELIAVTLQLVGQAEPLDRHRKHPIDRALQLAAHLATQLDQPLHPILAMAEMEVLLEIDFDERALERAV